MRPAVKVMGLNLAGEPLDFVLAVRVRILFNSPFPFGEISHLNLLKGICNGGFEGTGGCNY